MGKNIGVNQQLENYNIELLLNEVIKKTVNPEDYYEIAAILESLGWNDSSAAKYFGVIDIFELSKIIWNMINNKAYFQPFVEVKKTSVLNNMSLIISSFLRGLIFALPMAISVISMLTLRFSLWSYENSSTELATSIAIGTILSFVTIGGFTQVIARRGFFYISQDYYNMAKRITYYFVKVGYVTTFIVAIILILFNYFFGYLPYNMIIVAALYYIFLCSNWLIITITSILKREFTFTGLLCFGIFLVYILFKIAKLNIVISQIISLFIVSIVSIILIIYFFNKDGKKLEKGIAPTLPKKSVMIYSLAPYFYYGFLYFSFLFIDRVVAWSTTGDYMPYIIWFRGDYELGLDFALLMLMIPMGMVEVTVSRLMGKLEVAQKNSFNDGGTNINKKYLRFYIKNVILVSLSAILSSIFVYFIVWYLNKNSSLLTNSKFVFNNITYFVFIVALIAYSILSVALSNVVILFSLSQPKLVTKAMFYSVLINFFVGFLLSRWFHYYFAVLGLLIGSIFFCIVTCYCVVKVLNNLDYYLYVSS